VGRTTQKIYGSWWTVKEFVEGVRNSFTWIRKYDSVVLTDESFYSPLSGGIETFYLIFVGHVVRAYIYQPQRVNDYVVVIPRSRYVLKPEDAEEATDFMSFRYGDRWIVRKMDTVSEGDLYRDKFANLEITVKLEPQLEWDLSGYRIANATKDSFGDSLSELDRFSWSKATLKVFRFTDRTATGDSVHGSGPDGQFTFVQKVERQFYDFVGSGEGAYGGYPTSKGFYYEWRRLSDGVMLGEHYEANIIEIPARVTIMMIYSGKFDTWVSDATISSIYVADKFDTWVSDATISSIYVADKFDTWVGEVEVSSVYNADSFSS